MSDPKDKLYQYQGVGTGGGGGTHIYADLTGSEPFALLATLTALAEYADSVRDQHPAVYKAATAALLAGTLKLQPMLGMPRGK